MCCLSIADIHLSGLELVSWRSMKNAALFEEAESFQHLQDLELDRACFISSNITLPHTVKRVAFRGVCSQCVVRLDQCKCATFALGGSHIAG